MFRNPRENAQRHQEDYIGPSVGRPPSPQLSSTNATSATRSASNSGNMTSVKANHSLPTIGRQPVPKAKPRSNAVKNGNILSFFKKAPNGQPADPLFLDGANFGDLARGNALQAKDEWNDTDDELYRDDEAQNERFNENSGSNKRRKLSLTTEEKIDAEAQYRPDAAGAGAKACSPPPPDFDDSGDTPKEPIPPANSFASDIARRSGPFVDESDGEDETPDVMDSRTAMQTQKVPLNDTFKTDIKEKEVECPPVDTETRPPQLHREATSLPDQDGFAGFEGMEDFEDEYEEGDEFVERRFQREQRLLEMQEQGFEGEVDMDSMDDLPPSEEEQEAEEIPEEKTADQDSIPACPICNASFGEVSDQEASVHVNHCLDGNPTPLPLSKGKVKEESIADPPTPTPAPPKFRRPVRAPKPGQDNPFTLDTGSKSSSAFSRLMSGKAEDNAWAVAAAEEHASRGKPAYLRTCPFYKILPGFNICVDAFRYGAVQGCKAYFLSHFHSDHYIGLTASWCHGPIYCSRPTGNLVRQQLRVDPKWVIDLEFEKKEEVPGSNGVFVTMIPANHCPGSSIYLFEKQLSQGPNPRMQRVLHCGDFRACPAHIEHPLLKPDVIDAINGRIKQQKINVCYLDTTYLNPKYAFPSQEEVIKACADMCVSLSKDLVDKDDDFEQMKSARAGGAMAKFVRQDSKPNGTVEEVTPSRSSPDIEIKQEEEDEDDTTVKDIKTEHSPKPSSHNISNDRPISKPSTPTPTTNPKTPPPKKRGRLLVVIGTYSIGKERICLGIARALNSLIYAPPGKQRIVRALEDPELLSRITSNPREAQIHMTPLFEIRAETLGDYLAEYSDTFSRAVGFRPSGWNYRPPGSRFTESPAVHTVLFSENWKSNFTMRDLVPQRGSNSRSATYGVPYSEHSSFRELTMFCCALRIEKVIPTVNVGSAKSREKMKMWVERWHTWQRKEGLFRIKRPEESLALVSVDGVKVEDVGVGGGGKVGGGVGGDRGSRRNNGGVNGRDEENRGEWYAGRGTWQLRTNL